MRQFSEREINNRGTIWTQCSSRGLPPLVASKCCAKKHQPLSSSLRNPQLLCSVGVLLVSATTEVDINGGLVVWKDLDYLQRG